MLTLRRGKETVHGTHGSLYMDGKMLCYTLELPWKDNAPMVSCIPQGNYECIKHNSDKFPDTWQITAVKGRDAILIHAGNTKADTHGCILVGLGVNDGGITKSQAALSKLRGIFPRGFTLEIINAG